MFKKLALTLVAASSCLFADAKTITEADGTTIEMRADGSKLIKRPNGTTIEIKADGSKVIQKPNGTKIEIPARR